MPSDHANDMQDWRKLAEQASHEQNPAKLRHLIADLCDLVVKEQQSKKPKDQPY